VSQECPATLAYSIAHETVQKYSARMQVTVTLLRRNGFRIQTDNLQVSGQLVIAERRVRDGMLRLAAEIQTPGPMLGDGPSIIALLFDPTIRNWRGANFKLNGWEIIDWKGEGRQLVIQEWACTIDGF
jgi:hypothetical protein